MEVIPIAGRAQDLDEAGRLARLLEEGNILLLTETPFHPSPEDAAFLRARKQTSSKTHKNIAYKPNRQRVTGVEAASAEDSERLRTILAAYSQASLAFLSRLFPEYARAWKVDYASFRPFEEAGRALPIRHRNDLMHLDAFPTRPTHGGRILRAFTNIHPTQERVWATSVPFEQLAADYAVEAGLHRVTGPMASLRRGGRHLARLAGLKTPDRSPYDEFMLGFHHYLKQNAAFQQRRVQTSAFPPGATWISFTDHIAHAVLSGQYALEQTCIVPYEALRMPERAPIAVLERLAGRPLAAPPAPPAARRPLEKRALP